MTSLPDHASSSRNAEAWRADWRAALIIPWFAILLPLAAVSLIALVVGDTRGVASFFFKKQDCPILALTGAILLVLRFAPARWMAAAAIMIDLRGRRAIVIAVLFTLAATAAGWFLVFHAYPLSMDEFMATFDATILRRGQAIAMLPPAWRPYMLPLQPQFMLYAASGAGWVSIYLPVNALLRTAFGFLGADWAVGPMCAAASLTAVYGIARRIWPERPDAAALAVILLATSSQFLLTGMTPYAMTAHLAFNMTWLWLFLRPDWPSQIGAVIVAALACGLHQMVFHPLFAMPFVLALWLERRWDRAGFHTLAYALIGLFWIFYWKLVLPSGGSGAKGGDGLGMSFFLGRLAYMAAAFNPSSVGLMTQNLVRFVAWQNPMLPILCVAGIGAAIQTRGPLRCLLAGAALTTVSIWFLMPYQGHGWGYRYLHGFLGGFALVAALGWIELTNRLGEFDRRVLAGIGALTAIFAIFVLLPLRAGQAEAMVRPFATASRAIDRTPADVVFVDPAGLFYATDLVRNDPFLRNRPKRMDLSVMTDEQVRTICGKARVALFDRQAGLALGFQSDQFAPTALLMSRRKLVADLGCARVPTAR